VTHWFALDESRPLFAFAGIWRPWTGIRGPKRDEPVEQDHLLFSFLTTEANDVMRPIHAKAVPVILTADQFDTWLSATNEEALALQRPLPNEAMKVVATGDRKDEAA
jgi:putative SOS response-associated peptidase YedK